jgi:tetratricopeptide (TPR) repeat protein
MRQRIFFLAVCGIILNAACATMLNAVSLDQLIKQGIALRDSGKVYEAIDRFNQALKAKPKHSGANYELGKTYLKINDGANAEKYLTNALNYGYDQLKTRTALITAYLISAKTQEAIMEIQTVLDLKPKSPELHTLLGDAYLQKTGTLALAEEEYRTALGLDSNYVPAIVGMGNYFKAKRQPSEAFVMFEKAIKLNPKYAPAYYSYALVLAEKKMYDKSVLQLNEFIKLEPNDPKGYTKLADIYSKVAETVPQEKVKYFEAAIGNVNLAVSYGDTTLGTLKFLSFLMRKAVRPADNKEVLKKILVKTPDDVTTWIELGQTYAKLDSYALALPAYRKALAIDTLQWTNLAFTMGFAYYQVSKFDTAVVMFTEKIKRDTLAAGAYFNRALARIMINKNDPNIVKDFEKGLKIQPNYIQGHLWLAQTYHFLGNKAKARAEYTAVLKLDSKNKDAKEGLRLLDQVVIAPVEKVDYRDDYDPGDTLY